MKHTSHKPKELTACPACGMYSGIREYRDQGGGRIGTRCRCEICGCRTDFKKSQSAAVTSWEKGLVIKPKKRRKSE